MVKLIFLSTMTLLRVEYEKLKFWRRIGKGSSKTRAPVPPSLWCKLERYRTIVAVALELVIWGINARISFTDPMLNSNSVNVATILLNGHCPVPTNRLPYHRTNAIANNVVLSFSPKSTPVTRLLRFPTA
jgi:hypothetical protein